MCYNSISMLLTTLLPIRAHPPTRGVLPRCAGLILCWGSVLCPKSGALDWRWRLWWVLGVRLRERRHGTTHGGRLALAMEAGLLVDKPAASHPKEHIEESQDQWHIESGEASTRLRCAISLLWNPADANGRPFDDVVGAHVILDISHSLGPGTGARKPEQRHQCSQAQIHDGYSLVLCIHLAGEEVNAKNSHAVEERQHARGNKELSIAGKVEGQLNGLKTAIIRCDGAGTGHLEREVGHPEWIPKLDIDFEWAVSTGHRKDWRGPKAGCGCKSKYRKYELQDSDEPPGLFQNSEIKIHRWPETINLETPMSARRPESARTSRRYLASPLAPPLPCQRSRRARRQTSPAVRVSAPRVFLPLSLCGIHKLRWYCGGPPERASLSFRAS